MMIAAAQSSLYIFLDVGIITVQLGHFLACLLVNQSFLQHNILLCHLHTDMFPQILMSLGDRLLRVKISPRTDPCGTP